MGSLLLAPTLFAALGSGLIAGFFLAFSATVMWALERQPPPAGIAAMQAINIVVLNPIFLGVFFGTAILSLVLDIVALLRWSDPGSGYLLAGSLLYFVGTFLVTLVCNVPLNNRLAAVEPDSAEGKT
ncbi:MAG TPA: anthrone oxygenase family protein, partial [Methyloceanibacter sp.]|nr:anthrone oxygenase family protein [Methyloceanibacter sp.]